MSDSTTDDNRLSFVVEWGLPRLPEREEESSQQWERGLRVPGCLTSEDEERETWTAESLRLSDTEELRLLSSERGRKTSAVHVLRLHHRCQRCESRAAHRLRSMKNGGTSSKRCDQPVQSSSPT